MAGVPGDIQVSFRCRGSGVQRSYFHTCTTWCKWVSDLLMLGPRGTNLSLTSDHVIARLDKQKKRITETWKEFSADFGLENTAIASKDPPGIEALLSAVTGANKAWAQNREYGLGKAKNNVESFLRAMNDCSFLFSVIPNGSMYTSLVTGVVSSVVKVRLIPSRPLCPACLSTKRGNQLSIHLGIGQSSEDCRWIL